MAFLELLEDLRDDELLAEDRRRSDGERFEEDGEHRVCMVYGEDGIEDIRRVDVHVALREIAVGYQVLMGEHDSLRRSRRSRCEEYGRDLLGVGMLTLRLRSIHVEDERVLVRWLEGVLGDKPCLAILVDPVDALLVDEEPRDAAEGDERLHLAVLQRVVEGDDDRAGIDDAEVCDRPLRAVLARHADLIALPHALGKEEVRDLPDLLLGLSICEALLLGGECAEAEVVRIPQA